MYSFSELQESLPSLKQSRIVSGGFGLWVVWSGQMTKALTQTLQDHGGIKMTSAPSQALWFFSSTEVFKALARLQIWARLNPLHIFFQVIPASFLVGWDMTISLSVSADLTVQNMVSPSSFEVLVHPKCVADVKGIAGLSTDPVNTLPGVANVEWATLQADPSYSYESSLGWYFIIKPLGNPLDRDFMQGWRHFFSSAESIIQRLGIKFIFNETCLILPLENLRLLRTWCKEMISLVHSIKSDPDGNYWPCTMVAVQKEGRNFNEDLPRKVNLDWQRLTPDYPYLTYRYAYLLGSEFNINQVAYFSERLGLDNWCYASLTEDAESGTGGGSLHVSAPRRLQAGVESECFYCGLKTHRPIDCPSRQIIPLRPKVWEKFVSLGMDDFDKISQEVDDILSADQVGGLAELLDNKGKSGVYMRCLFEISQPFQLRLFSHLWRSRSKDWEGAFDHLSPEEGEYIWAALESLRLNNHSNAEHLLAQAMVRYPRSYQPRSLQALLHMEAEDLNQALFFFEEAQRLSYTDVQRAVFSMNQARCYETQMSFEKAIQLYKQAEQFAPSWLDTVYRQAVCLIKMGFTEHAMVILLDFIARDAMYFNRILIDPEIERGRFHIMNALWDIWDEAKNEAEEAREQVEQLESKLFQWFTPENEFLEKSRGKLEVLQRLTKVENFVAFKRLQSGVMQMEAELQERVASEIKVVEKRVSILLERLIEVQREASWFPFPKLLREFNRDFNFCADKLNWLKTQNLHTAENFRKGQVYLGEVDERLHVLQGRLVTLRVIRDATFFILLLGRNFIWMELVGLGVAIILVPLLIYGMQNYITGWAVDLLLKEKWQLQKGLILILSIVAMAVSALKTAIIFEKRKEQLFNEEYEKAVTSRKDRKKNSRRKQNGKKSKAKKS
ncbi:MAG: tetratricopeptide repeat protein [Desulfovibrio sp.]|uniref:tetratricopeptide repeat protein n=1 Tax=Desulfovibrio sp. 7SRBS1 TaxID=3378064 RepID=UPI003B400DF4